MDIEGRQIIIPGDKRVRHTRTCVGCRGNAHPALVLRLAGLLTKDLAFCSGCVTRMYDAVLSGRDYVHQLTLRTGPVN